MFFLPLFLVSFFFLSHIFLSGKTPVSCLVGATPHKERRASVALICLHCSKEGMYIPARQLRQLRKVCHAEGVLCLSSWQQTQQLQTKVSLQDVGLIVFLNLARRSLFFVKHDKCTDKATNYNDCKIVFRIDAG